MSDPEPVTAPPSRSFSQLKLIGSVFAVLILLLAAWYIFVLRQSYSVLYSDLPPAHASAIVAELEKQGTRYRLANGGADILARTGEVDALRLRLSSADLSLGGAHGFELFNENDMGLTDFAQKIRYQRAIQGELARTIMMLEGVADARVHISLPERALFRSERRDAEAAVTLAMRAGLAPSLARIEGVQRLVAAAVPDLAMADVVVLNAAGEVISTRAAPGLLSSDAAPDEQASRLASNVMHAAVPNRRFRVSIDRAAGIAGDNGEPPVRMIVVTTDSLLNNDEIFQVRGALQRAGMIDAGAFDTVSFRVEPPLIAEPAPDQPPPTAERQTRTANTLWIAFWLCVGGIVALLVAWSLGRKHAPAALTPQSLDELVGRMRTALGARPGAPHG